jgi:hypothetical protein
MPCAWLFLALQYKSDTSCIPGAFNRGVTPANPFDLGWGLHNTAAGVKGAPTFQIQALE